MNANLRWILLVGLLPMVLLPRATRAGEPNVQSKLAGSWVLIEGVKEFVGEQQPLPETDRGRVYLVIKPSGHFYQAVHFPNGALDDLVNPGDRMHIVDGSHLEVAGSTYSPEASELVLALHDGPNGQDYRVLVEAKLLPDGNVSYRTVSPSYGGADLVVSATLRRIEREPPWQPDGLIREWRLHGSNSLSVDLSADGRYVIAAGLTDKVVHVWDVETGSEIQRFVGHVNYVCAVAISADGRLAASGSRTKGSQRGSEDSIRVWDVETGAELHRIDAFSSVTSLRFLPDGTSLVASGNPSHSVAEATAGVWDVETGERQTCFANPYGVQHAATSPDGRSTLCSGFVFGKGNPIRLFETATGKELLRFGADLRGLYSVTFSPDGRRVLTTSGETFVREWDVHSGDLLRRVEVDWMWASCAIYLPDGNRIITANESDNSLRIWDIRSGEELKQFVGHRDHIHDLKVSLDGLTAVSCGADSTVRVWRVPQAISERR